MFLDRLVSELAAPHNRLGELDETLLLDLDSYRALLMQEARALCQSGHIEQDVVAWAFTCIADGWVDEHVQHVRDSLLELGAVSDQQHLDRLLHTAVLQVLGTQEPLDPADSLLLTTVTRPLPGADAAPLGLRLLARRYARELGLLMGNVRTRLGDLTLRLPRAELPVFMLALEVLQSTGAGDRWRSPPRALALLLSRLEFDVPTNDESRRALDPEGLLSWRRIRRLVLMGLCEAVGGDSEADGAACCRHRLLPRGEAVLRQVLADPQSPVVALAAGVLQEQTRDALRPLLSWGQPGAPPLAGGAAIPAPVKPSVIKPATMRPAVRVRPAEAPASVPLSVPVHAPPAEPFTTMTMTMTTAPAPRAPSVPEGGRQEVPSGGLQAVSLRHLLQRAWDEIRASSVQFSIQGGDEHVCGERRALLQALREVLRCASEAAQRGGRGPMVVVELRGGDQAVLVMVSDNGPPRTQAASESKGSVLELLLARAGDLRVAVEPMPAGVTLALPPPRLGGLTVALTLPREALLAARAAA